MEEILSVSRNHVTEDDWEPFQNDIDKLYRRK
jgi:hypothetical protein